MKVTLIHDILRAVTTDIMLILLIFTMSTPKYNKKYIYISVAVLITSFNLATNMYFYLSQNYSAVVLTDLITLILIGFALKPFFSETAMQWCFSFVTLLNIYAAIVFISYYLSAISPHPYYGVIVLRIVCFGVIIWIFRKKIGPLYRSVKEYWHVYSLLTVSLLVNYIYYLLCGDIEQTMQENFIPIMFLIFLTLFIYIGIFLSLKIIIQRYTLREENIKIQTERVLLQKTTAEMQQRLSLMDDAVKQMRVVQHDRRHFNATLTELIEQGEIAQALTLIQKQSAALPQGPRSYCENVEVNAAVCYYVAMANEKGIACDIKLNIPKNVSVDGLELAIMISNLLENAIQGVSAVVDEKQRKISFTVIDTGQLILEIKNYYVGKIETDEYGLPLSKKSGHGFGTQSVVSFAKKWNAELDYEISNNLFQVRMII
ncbi:GHKL domain-containing protein [Paludicola sp. MB14-C6]|uniref:GHKL domain-containing protein n=1 Tax=Paludihabitans sp. MB14-C6 TaxID=3070656 RepID=UPI0027DE262C|nr:GHKL domain-containing protein [Paludicola sp. MB14-C6]WMJ23000.1 GHKL domain-containing protein [Paludicola sp. MB14-C6]